MSRKSTDTGTTCTIDFKKEGERSWGLWGEHALLRKKIARNKEPKPEPHDRITCQCVVCRDMRFLSKEDLPKQAE